MRTDLPTHELAGGQRRRADPCPAAAVAAPARGVLGAAPAGRQALDRHLPEIAALIDPRQFELITAPATGVVVIQGGAGSGKTTIGLHRLAYLAYTVPGAVSGRAAWSSSRTAPRWRRTSAQVLPSLGMPGVRVVTFRRPAPSASSRAGSRGCAPRIVDDAVPPPSRA